MNTYVILITLTMGLALVSCKDTKTDNSNAERPKGNIKEVTEDARSHWQNEGTDQYIEHSNGSTGAADNTGSTSQNTAKGPDKEINQFGTVAQTSGSTGASNNLQMSNAASSSTDFEKLFSHLEMTEGQVNRFRKAMKDFQKKHKSNPNDEMMGSIEDQQDRQLKVILTQEQYGKYKAWKKSN